MQTADVLQLAWTGLRQNKLRSVLTATGVTVGVFAFTTIVAMGAGMEGAIVGQLTDGESQTRLVVRPGFGPREKRDAKIEGVTDPAKIDRLKKSINKRRRGGPSQMMRKLLTTDALQAIEKEKGVQSVRPLAIDRFKLTFGEQVLDGALSYGLDPSADMWNVRVIHGQPLNAGRGVWLHEYLLYRWGYRSDAEQAKVVGKTLLVGRPRESSTFSAMLATARANGLDLPVSDEQAKAMFQAFAGRQGGDVEVSESGELNMELPILGVIRERIESDGFEVFEDSFSMQADMFLPQDLAEELFEQIPSNLARGYNVVAIELDTLENVKTLEKSLRKEGFRTVSVDTILERVERVMATLTAMVSGLTIIALVVAVLGIVNTMVMNVSERTKEIGILKALGGTDGDVRMLFLMESGMIGAFGGIAGVIMALIASLIGDEWTQAAIKEATQYEFDQTVFSFHPMLILVALGAAFFLSVLAALGPATRASRVDPTVALRDE